MILHIDLDCFYCSAERILNPSLRGIPLAVGGGDRTSKLFSKKNLNIQIMDENRGSFSRAVFYQQEQESFHQSLIKKKENNETIRGIVVTSSYEARAKGVKTAMSLSEALSLCPNLTVVPPNHLHYHNLSHKLYTLLTTLIPVVEQASIDEFYCDISGMQEEKEPQKFALHVKNMIKEKLSLPVSIGIAKTKRIAKMATNDAKPNGIKYIVQEEVVDYVKDKPIKKFPGIGKSYEKKLQNYGIGTIGDALRAKHLFDRWGTHAKELYACMLGEDKERVQPDSKRKSIGMSRSFDAINDREEIQRRIVIFVRHIAFMVNKLQLHPATFYLKLRYRYNIKSENRYTEYRLFSEKMLKDIMLDLYKKTDTYKDTPVVFICVSVSNFIEHNKKSVSLIDFDTDKKQNALNESLQKLRSKYGIDTIRSAREI
jgi:DNA polymerase-4